MSISYSRVYLCESKFGGEFFKTEAEALDHDIVMAANILERSTKAEFIKAAMTESGVVHTAMQFLMSCRWDIEYHEGVRAKEARAKAIVDVDDLSQDMASDLLAIEPPCGGAKP